MKELEDALKANMNQMVVVEDNIGFCIIGHLDFVTILGQMKYYVTTYDSFGKVMFKIENVECINENCHWNLGPQQYQGIRIKVREKR